MLRMDVNVVELKFRGTATKAFKTISTDYMACEIRQSKIESHRNG